MIKYPDIRAKRDIDAHGIRSLEGLKLIAHAPDILPDTHELHRFLFQNFYRHYRLNQMASRAERILGLLFESYTRDKASMPPRFQEWCDEVGLERAVCDYIAGMTDRYAESEYKRFFLPGP